MAQVKSSTLRESRSELLRKLNEAMRRSSGLGVVFSQAVARKLGIGASDLECIDIIALGNEVTAGELASATGLTTGAVTGIIDRLERAGYVRRERDLADRRKVHVKMLPRAMAKAAAHYGPLAVAVDGVLAGYTDSELTLLLGFFTRSTEVMQREIERVAGSVERRKRTE
jgi:DNA-binding MarR family transcriptional regulator